MKVEAVLALPERQITVELTLDESATLGAVVERLEAMDEFAGVRLDGYACGVFGEICDQARVLVEGDRIEFYRPLIADAKERRRKIAREGARARGRQKVRGGATGATKDERS